MLRHRHDGGKCGSCAFWGHLTDDTVACRLRAPTPSDERDEVAHWAQTFHEDYCGEWVANGETAPTATVCKRCIYWSYLERGLTPVDLRDQLPGWWARAGHCLRHAPQPSGMSGHKAFWCVTHENDSCFEGRTAP